MRKTWVQSWRFFAAPSSKDVVMFLWFVLKDVVEILWFVIRCGYVAVTITCWSQKRVSAFRESETAVSKEIGQSISAVNQKNLPHRVYSLETHMVLVEGQFGTYIASLPCTGVSFAAFQKPWKLVITTLEWLVNSEFRVRKCRFTVLTCRLGGTWCHSNWLKCQNTQCRWTRVNS